MIGSVTDSMFFFTICVYKVIIEEIVLFFFSFTERCWFIPFLNKNGHKHLLEIKLIQFSLLVTSAILYLQYNYCIEIVNALIYITLDCLINIFSLWPKNYNNALYFWNHNLFFGIIKIFERLENLHSTENKKKKFSKWLCMINNLTFKNCWWINC